MKSEEEGAEISSFVPFAMGGVSPVLGVWRRRIEMTFHYIMCLCQFTCKDDSDFPIHEYIITCVGGRPFVAGDASLLVCLDGSAD